MSTLGAHLGKAPLDFNNLEGVTDPDVFDREFHKSIRENLQAGGFLPPTEGITKPVEQSQNTEGFFESLINNVFSNSGPEAFDTPEDTYSERRFDFISAESNYSETIRKDGLNRTKIGYDFNLDSPELRAMASKVLSKTDEQIDAIATGTQGISSRDARVLYEARVSRAERFVKEKFKGTPLAANQQIALVSLAYQNEGLIGPKLLKAVQNGNWKGAENEIRNRSNRYKNSGIAERRNREADLFMSMNKQEEDDGFDIGSLFSFGSSQTPVETPQKQQSVENNPAGFDVKEVREKAPKIETEAVDSILKQIPAHVRMVVEDVFKNTLGIDQKTEIKTSDFFNDDELSALVGVVKREYSNNGGKKKAGVKYGAYEKGMSDVAFSSNELGLTGQDPEESIKKTLGQFNYEINKQGELIVVDTYNFNDAEEMQQRFPGGWDKALHLMELSGKLINKHMGDGTGHSPMGLYGIVRRAAALYGSPEGEGVEFKINLGKVRLI